MLKKSRTSSGHWVVRIRMVPRIIWMEVMDGLSRAVSQAVKVSADLSGAFTLLFLQLGTLYAWGVFQAELANQKLGRSVVLSAIGGISGFFTAMGCLPVSGPRHFMSGPETDLHRAHGWYQSLVRE